jgi:toxin ParE1/3/4
MRHRLTGAAERDLRSILAHSARTFGTKRAKAYASDFERALEQIKRHPFANRERTEVSPAHRIHIFEAHLIFYRIAEDEEEIVVTRVLHGHQDWRSGLE